MCVSESQRKRQSFLLPFTPTLYTVCRVDFNLLLFPFRSVPSLFLFLWTLQSRSLALLSAAAAGFASECSTRDSVCSFASCVAGSQAAVAQSGRKECKERREKQRTTSCMCIRTNAVSRLHPQGRCCCRRRRFSSSMDRHDREGHSLRERERERAGQEQQER